LRASAADRSEAAGAEALRDEARADRDRWRKLAEKELAISGTTQGHAKGLVRLLAGDPF
jgi:hypothetical protein